MNLTYTKCMQKFADIAVIHIDVIVIIDLCFIIDSRVTHSTIYGFIVAVLRWLRSAIITPL